MKLLEIVALIFFGVIFVTLLLGSYILPEDRLKTQIARYQYGYALRVILWGSIYIVAIDMFVMSILLLVGLFK